MRLARQAYSAGRKSDSSVVSALQSGHTKKSYIKRIIQDLSAPKTRIYSVVQEKDNPQEKWESTELMVFLALIQIKWLPRSLVVSKNTQIFYFLVLFFGGVFARSPLSLPQTPFSRSLRSAICNPGQPYLMRRLRITNGGHERAKKQGLGREEGYHANTEFGISLVAIFTITKKMYGRAELKIRFNPL